MSPSLISSLRNSTSPAFRIYSKRINKTRIDTGLRALIDTEPLAHPKSYCEASDNRLAPSHFFYLSLLRLFSGSSIARLGKENLDRLTRVFCLEVEAREVSSGYSKTRGAGEECHICNLKESLKMARISKWRSREMLCRAVCNKRSCFCGPFESCCVAYTSPLFFKTVCSPVLQHKSVQKICPKKFHPILGYYYLPLHRPLCCLHSHGLVIPSLLKK